MEPKEWYTEYIGRHNCGGGFRGYTVKVKDLTFCNLCGKERKVI